jgi:hypothetical protein
MGGPGPWTLMLVVWDADEKVHCIAGRSSPNGPAIVVNRSWKSARRLYRQQFGAKPRR